MMRLIFASLVTGEKWMMAWWAVCTVITLPTESWGCVAFDALLFILNVYSWDYQRRHGGAP